MIDTLLRYVVYYKFNYNISSRCYCKNIRYLNFLNQTCQTNVYIKTICNYYSYRLNIVNEDIKLI